MLEINDALKVFKVSTNPEDDRVAINHLNLEIKEGDFVTIIGGNGSGKSTLMNAIAGAITLDSGTIKIAGKDVTKLPEYKRAAYLGRVFQDPNMGTASQMNIEENMMLATRRTKKKTLKWGFNKEDREVCVNKLKSLNLGLENRLEQKVGLLSGGQRQAVTLLMATIQRPDILLLDEHTAALDPKTAKVVLELTSKIVEEEKITIYTYKADVSNREEARGLIEFAIEKLKKIDVLINNAGISQMKLFTDITDTEWNDMLNINLNSAFYCTQEATKHMLINKEGCIINISSIWGITGASCEVHYSTAKAALNGFTKALAKELGPSNIRVNAIAPGMIDTDMNKNIPEQDKQDFIQEIPLEKIGKTEDISKCIEWLIEDNYTTGQIISINGGIVI